MRGSSDLTESSTTHPNFKRRFLYLLLSFLSFTSTVSGYDIYLPPRPYEHIDFNGKDHIECFIYETWGISDTTKEFIKLIGLESSFNQKAKNPKSSAVGLGQITKATAIDNNFSYKEIVDNSVANLVCAFNHFNRCLKKGKNFKVAKLLYQNGLYFLDNKKKEEWKQQ